MSDNGRRYDEKEARKILRRASELQSEAIGKNSDGVSLDELKHAASAVGFDPSLVARAASELDGGSSKLGSNGNAYLEEDIAGEINEEQWQEMVIKVRRAFGATGEVGKLGSSYEWTSSSDSGSIQLSATPSDGKTTIRLNSGFGQGIWVLWILGMSLGLVVSMIAGKVTGRAFDAGMGVAAFFATWCAIATAIHFLGRFWTRSHEAKCKMLMQELTRDHKQLPSIPHSSTNIDGNQEMTVRA